MTQAGQDWLHQSGSGCPDCFSAAHHVCARSHEACALDRDMQSRNIGTCRPDILIPIGRRFVPSLTAQALTTVFPFPISTCQNIITRTVFESLCPIILFPILFLTVLQAGPSYNIHVMNTRWMSILILIPSGLVYKIRCACNRIISGDQARKLRFPCLGRCVAATALFE